MADLRIQGMKEVGARLRALPLAVKDKIATGAVYAGARVMQAAVEATAPVRTGLLKANIRVARRRKDISFDEVQYVVYVQGVAPGSGRRSRKKTKRVKGVAQPAPQLPYYWIFLEFGTSKMAPHPFLVPAFVLSAPNALTTARDYASRRLDRVVKQLGSA